MQFIFGLIIGAILGIFAAGICFNGKMDDFRNELINAYLEKLNSLNSQEVKNEDKCTD